MKIITLKPAHRNLSLALALGAATLLPLALASCAKSEDKTDQKKDTSNPSHGDMGHDMSKMPNSDSR